MEEVYYNSQDVCDTLQVSKPTLRRWSSALEKEGIVIYRDKQERRLYSNANVEVLKALKQRLAQGEDTVSAIKAIKLTINKHIEHGQAPSDQGANPIEQRLNTLELEQQFFQMTEHLEKLTSEIKELKEDVKEHKELTKFQSHRYDQLLMEHVRQLHDMKKSENEASVSSEKEQKKWWEFWK